MAAHCDFKDKINSWIEDAHKLVNNSLCCWRKQAPFYDQEAAIRFFSELPNDLLGEIINTIDLPEDYQNIIAVCRRWRSVAHDLKSDPRRNLSFLQPLPKKFSLPVLLQPYGKDSNSYYFYSITKREVYNIQVPDMGNKWITGSWRGWLVTLDIADNNLIHLLNPVAKLKIPLPPLSTFPKPINSAIKFPWNISKIIIVSSENVTEQSDCTIVALEILGSSLHICRIGDETWKKIDLSVPSTIMDIIEFRGILYVVYTLGNLYAVETNPITKMTLIAGTSSPDAARYYLVESSKDLLLVARYFKYTSSYTKTIGFKVYRLAENKKGDPIPYNGGAFGLPQAPQGPAHKIWKDVKSLHGQMLFVGRNRTLCLPSNLYPKCKGNCIYFADDNGIFDIFRASAHRLYLHDSGVYHMNNKTIEYFIEEMSYPLSLPSIWFSPNPW
ncbi:F-box protein skip23 [Rhynchospora pubera]|uniref:F-box protein skip23 n=1 Tax=Rhynchospora pubera TaxID=906938 RepID=A0AAV8CNY5_9POAL|nr:F-box protein skip23 [Rhynchospora pubera]